MIDVHRLFSRSIQPVLPDQHHYEAGKNRTKQFHVLALLRERNEHLILQDTLDHLASFADGILLYDDASTDDSVAIALRHPSVVGIVVNEQWRSNRADEETYSRKTLHETGKLFAPDWFFYADADERFEGDVRATLRNSPESVAGIRISLLDAYLTPSDAQPYIGGALLNFRHGFGVERRDILMAWRNTPTAYYAGSDAREPQGIDESAIITALHCQHYGKALSEAHWEETCDYYAKHFPKYSAKWRARKGHAIHTNSDQGGPIYDWNTAKRKSVKIYPE